jgi:hypothetical protein
LLWTCHCTSHILTHHHAARCKIQWRFAGPGRESTRTHLHLYTHSHSLTHSSVGPSRCPPKMRVLTALQLGIVTQAWRVNANVEKTVFLGPALELPLAHAHPSLEDLRLPALSHAQTILPTQLRVHFPSTLAPHGLESWYLLHHLDAGRRYEVRVCWPATVCVSASSYMASRYGTRCCLVAWIVLAMCCVLTHPSSPPTSGSIRTLSTRYSIRPTW